jgi:nitrate reductase gamma subunit
MWRMDLLEFARGPALAFSVAVFVLGLAWRLYGIFRRPVRADHSEPRRADTAAGGLRAVFAKMLPPRDVKIRGAQMVNAYAYHIGLALIAFTFAPHIGFIERHLGIAWPALPDPVTYLATAVAIIGLTAALIARLSDGVLRLLSNFDDYFSWAVTMLPLLTGMALIERPYYPAPAVAPALPTTPGLLAIHLLSLELLLVWLPFGKLAHAALVFVSRWRTGADFTRKGAAL